jgi:hypothetical protein
VKHKVCEELRDNAGQQWNLLSYDETLFRIQNVLGSILNQLILTAVFQGHEHNLETWKLYKEAM